MSSIAAFAVVRKRGASCVPSQYAPSNQIKSELWGNGSWHVEKLRHRRRFQATFLAFVSSDGHHPGAASLFCRALWVYRDTEGTLRPPPIPGGRLFRKVPGLPGLGLPERRTTARTSGRTSRPAPPLQPVHAGSADVSAAGTVSAVRQPKPGRLPSGVGGMVWREVTSCSLAGCMAVINDNGSGFRCIPGTS